MLKIRTKNITAPKNIFSLIPCFALIAVPGCGISTTERAYICIAYALHGSKACSSHAVKEDFLIRTIQSFIKMWLDQIDKEAYVKELEAKSINSKLQLQKQLDKLTKDIDTLKKHKKNFVNLFADELLTHEEYRENVDATNTEINGLVLKKTELLSEFQHENVTETLVSQSQSCLAS